MSLNNCEYIRMSWAAIEGSVSIVIFFKQVLLLKNRKTL